MKDVKKTLEDQKEAVNKEFNVLEARRKQLLEASQNLQQQLSQVVTQQVELRGKWQLLEKLEKEFNSKEE